jgi:hypothetical protein
MAEDQNRSARVRKVVKTILRGLAGRRTPEAFLAEGFSLLSQAKPLLAEDDFEGLWGLFEELAKKEGEAR